MDEFYWDNNIGISFQLIWTQRGEPPEVERRAEGYLHLVQKPRVGYFRSEFWRKIWEVRKKNTKGTPRFLQLGTLENGTYLNTKGDIRVGAAFGETYQFFKN